MRILFAAPIGFERITLFISQYFIGLARAATKLGHEVRVVQTTENLYNPKLWGFLEKEFHTFRRYAKSIADAPHDLLLMRQLDIEARDFEPDLVIMHLIDTVYLSRTVQKFRQKGIEVFVWLGVHPTQVSSGIHDLLRAASKTLIYDSAYIPYFKNQLRIDNLKVVPLGCDVDYFDSVVPDEEFCRANASDVCFIGLFDEHRARYLNVLTGRNLVIWSWNFPRVHTTLQPFFRGEASGAKMIELYKSTKIGLNIHRSFEINGGNFRFFEIPACRTLQLVDEKPNVREYFEPGKELVTFSSEDDLREKAGYYLDHPGEATKIAAAGYLRVKRDHSLTKRIEQIIDIVR